MLWSVSNRQGAVYVKYLEVALLYANLYNKVLICVFFLWILCVGISVMDERNHLDVSIE